ncbi:MAG: Acyl-coenzyme A thioesterase PaaI [Stenotrophomonas maltophilia]|nr:MAG: Acyl-coenzyme A thioesterase PaaI [Stenotrophomonas maltophilia]
MTLDLDRLQSYTDHRGTPIPLLDLLDFRFCPPGEDGGPGHIAMRVGPDHLNGWRNAHGGLLMTLLDVSMALASIHADDQGRGVVTIEMKTNFLRPGGEVGELLEALGSVRHRTYSMAFCEAEVRNARGEVVATASGTFKFVNKPRPVADA